MKTKSKSPTKAPSNPKSKKASRSTTSFEREAQPLTDAEIASPNGPPPLPPDTADTQAPELEDRISEDALENIPLPPEIVTPELKELKTWDDSQREFGTRAPSTGLEDESTDPETLVEEGLDEAEEELRTVQEGDERVAELEEIEIDEAKAKEENRTSEQK